MTYPVGKIVRLENNKFFGTGFLYHSNNIVVTCDHVILAAKEAKAKLGFELAENGKVFPLIESRENPVLDFRFLYSNQKIADNPITQGSFENIEPSIHIYPIYFQHNYNEFIKEELPIRACGKYFNKIGPVDFFEFISGNIVEGASGGPVLNHNGQLIGIISQLFIERQYKEEDEYKVCKAYVANKLQTLIEHVLNDIKADQ